jgi:hypothetical protein
MKSLKFLNKTKVNIDQVTLIISLENMSDEKNIEKLLINCLQLFS